MEHSLLWLANHMLLIRTKYEYSSNLQTWSNRVEKVGRQIYNVHRKYLQGFKNIFFH